MPISAFAAAALSSLALAMGSAAAAGEPEACGHFRWDVSRELALMQQAPLPLNSAVNTDDRTAQIQPGKLYAVKLWPQSTVAYALAPGKPTSAEGAQGGLVHFRVGASGIYRISLGSSHWIDVIAAGSFIRSRDFQGAHGCERPHKIVEFELPADQPLILQFSGAAATAVLVAISAVGPVH